MNLRPWWARPGGGQMLLGGTLFLLAFVWGGNAILQLKTDTASAIIALIVLPGPALIGGLYLMRRGAVRKLVDEAATPEEEPEPPHPPRAAR